MENKKKKEQQEKEREVYSKSNDKSEQLFFPLPKELFFHILCFLDIDDLKPIACVNRTFRSIVQDARAILQNIANRSTSERNLKDQYLYLVYTRETKRKTLAQSFDFFNKGRYDKALEHAVSGGLIGSTESPQELASFLQKELQLPGARSRPLSKKHVGIFLSSQNGKSLLEAYISTLDFQGLIITDAMRLMFCGFDIPANDIAQLWDVFGRQYYKKNHSTCNFPNSGAVANFAFCIYSILYQENHTLRNHPLPFSSFFEIARAVNGGKDLSEKYLREIYNRGLHQHFPGTANFSPIPKVGWVKVRYSDFSWKRRFLILCDNSLFYFKKPGNIKPVGIIPLENVNVDKGKKLKYFIVTSSVGQLRDSGQPNGIRDHFACACETEEECLSWIETLKKFTTENSSFLQSYSKESNGTGVLKQKLGKSRSGSFWGFLHHRPSESSIQKPPSDSHPSKFAPYFGVPVEQILEREGGKVPIFVEKAISFLELHLTSEGLLRLSGSYLEMAEIRASIERGEPIDFTNRDPNIVAGLLKHFYRELPVPIFSRDINTSFAAVFSFVTGEAALEEVRFLLHTLPESQFNLLKALVAFLVKVVNHSDKNLMGTNNILRVVTPTLNCVPAVIALGIEHFDYLFSDDPVISELRKETDSFIIEHDLNSVEREESNGVEEELEQEVNPENTHKKSQSLEDASFFEENLRELLKYRKQVIQENSGKSNDNDMSLHSSHKEAPVQPTVPTKQKSEDISGMLKEIDSMMV